MVKPSLKTRNVFYVPVVCRTLQLGQRLPNLFFARELRSLLPTRFGLQRRRGRCWLRVIDADGMDRDALTSGSQSLRHSPILAGRAAVEIIPSTLVNKV